MVYSMVYSLEKEPRKGQELVDSLCDIVGLLRLSPHSRQPTAVAMEACSSSSYLSIRSLVNMLPTAVLFVFLKAVFINGGTFAFSVGMKVAFFLVHSSKLAQAAAASVTDNAGAQQRSSQAIYYTSCIDGHNKCKPIQ